MNALRSGFSETSYSKNGKRRPGRVRSGSTAAKCHDTAKLTAPPLSLITRTTIVMKTHCEKLGGITLGETEASS